MPVLGTTLVLVEQAEPFGRHWLVGDVPVPLSQLNADQMLASMMDQVKRFNEGRLTSYWDVIQSSR